MLLYLGGSVSNPRSLTGYAVTRLLISPLVVLHDPFNSIYFHYVTSFDNIPVRLA